MKKVTNTTCIDTIKDCSASVFARVRAYTAGVPTWRVVVAVTILFCALGAVLAIPAPLDITQDKSVSFRDAVADRTHPAAKHSYIHSGKTDFFAVSTGFHENSYWFVYGNHERGKIESFARKCGSWILGTDFDADMDGAFVICNAKYNFGETLKPGRYVYLGKIRSRTWFLKEFVWERPVYMDESLPRSEKKNLLVNFKRDMVRSLQQNFSGKEVTALENGVFIKGGFLTSNCQIEVL